MSILRAVEYLIGCIISRNPTRPFSKAADNAWVFCGSAYFCRPPQKMLEIPGHALHEKGLQTQKGVGPLVSSQEERGLLALVVKCG